MKNFWPHRSAPKGFLTKNIAREYQEKLFIGSSDKSLNELLDRNSLNSKKEDSNTIGELHSTSKQGHWANRDFSEYRIVT